MANNSTLNNRAEKNGKNMRTLQTSAGPRQSTIKNILSYSKALKYEETEQLGRIETVLN